MSPLWDSPPRTLKTLLERVRNDGRGVGGKRQIKLATVQAVREGRLYVVDGVAIPTTGYDPSLRAGERVYVLYIDDMPTVILRHLIRRAQFGVDISPPTGGVIEQLFVAQDPNAGNAWDIWFRNYSVCKPLGARKLLSGSESLDPTALPVAVRWGVDGRHFATRTQKATSPFRPVYTLWRLERDGKKVLRAGQVPTLTKVKTYDWNTDSTVLETITATWSDGPDPFGGGTPVTVVDPISLSSPGVVVLYPSSFVHRYTRGALDDTAPNGYGPAFCLSDHDPPHIVVGVTMSLSIAGRAADNDVAPFIPGFVQVLEDLPQWSYGFVIDTETHVILLTDYPSGGGASSLLGVGPYLNPNSVDWFNIPTNGQPLWIAVGVPGPWAISSRLGGAAFTPLAYTVKGGLTAFVSASDYVSGSPVNIAQISLRVGAVLLRDGVVTLTPRALGSTIYGAPTVWVQGNRHHALWSFPLTDVDTAPWRLSSLDKAVTKDIGVTVSDFYAVNQRHLSLPAFDYMWTAAAFDGNLVRLNTKTTKQYFFVKGWDWGTKAPTLSLSPSVVPPLDLSPAGFPPEDSTMAPQKTLAQFPKGVSDLADAFVHTVNYDSVNTFQVVEDSTVLSPLGRALSS